MKLGENMTNPKEEKQKLSMLIEETPDELTEEYRIKFSDLLEDDRIMSV